MDNRQDLRGGFLEDPAWQKCSCCLGNTGLLWDIAQPKKIKASLILVDISLGLGCKQCFTQRVLQSENQNHFKHFTENEDHWPQQQHKEALGLPCVLTVTLLCFRATVCPCPWPSPRPSPAVPGSGGWRPSGEGCPWDPSEPPAGTTASASPCSAGKHAHSAGMHAASHLGSAKWEPQVTRCIKKRYQEWGWGNRLRLFSKQSKQSRVQGSWVPAPVLSLQPQITWLGKENRGLQTAFRQLIDLPLNPSF